MLLEKRDIAGLVLIGGQSLRMGSPKALVTLAGIPLWQHALHRLSPHVNEVLFVGHVGGLNLPAHIRLLDDTIPNSGPLGGLLAGLEGSGCEHHVLLAVDYPLVRDEFIEQLKAHSEPALAVCGHTSEALEPLVAYYHRDCAPSIRGMLSEGETRTHRLFDRVVSNVIEAGEIAKIDPAKWTFFNVNTPADLIEAEKRLQSGYPT